MRVFIGTGLLIAWSLWAAPPGEPRTKGAKTAVAGAPAAGVKVPGIQISFSSLKADMEFEGAAAASFIGVTDGVAIQNAAKDGLLKIDTKAKEKTPGVPIAGIKEPCGGVVSAFGSLWVASCGSGSLVRLDGKTLKPTATLATGTGSSRIGLAATADSVWMLTDDRGTLSRIDPQQNEVVAEFRLPPGCGSLVFGETALWVACPAENRVMRINPQTNLPEKSIEVSARPEALAIGNSSVWVLCAKEGKVERIDPKTNKVIKTIETLAPAEGGTIAAGEGSVWVSSAGFPLTRIDPESDKVVQQFYGAGAGVVQAGLGSVWLAGAHGKLLRLDPKRIAATLAE